MIASVDQSIRGIRHREYRPDLLILDDVEDMDSAKKIEGRAKLFDWFTREIVPLGDIGTRTIIVGNLLHEDSLVMKLRRMIDRNELSGTYCWFPLVNERGVCLWHGKDDGQSTMCCLPPSSRARRTAVSTSSGVPRSIRQNSMLP